MAIRNLSCPVKSIEMKLQLIIPMSGIGKRFIDAGYQVPKFLIEVDGKSIIEHVIDMYPGIESPIFICNKDHLENRTFNLRKQLLKIRPKSNIVSIEAHKKGPIFAVLKALSYVKLDLPTIVNYCDFNCIWNFNLFKEYIKQTNCDGCVMTYKGFHPHMIHNTNYAYVKTKNLKIIDIQEKKPFTSIPMNENASSGAYFFKSGALMKKYFLKTIEDNLNINGEFYVSMSYKPMIKDNLNLNIFEIEKFMQWGTPVDLKEYIWYSQLFNLKISARPTSKINAILLMPSAGKGSRFADAGYDVPKPMIKVSNKSMFIQALKDLPCTKQKFIVVSEKMEYKNNMIEEIKKNNISCHSIFVKGNTRGQSETCYISVKNLNPNSSLLISSCDHGVIYNQKVFDKLIANKEIDIIVWGCKDYPNAIRNPEMYGWISHKNNNVNGVSVKKRLNDEYKSIIIGTFFFREIRVFKKLVEEQFDNEELVNNEFYVDSLVNIGLKKGLKIKLFEVDSFLCWGTPNELKTYQYWQDCFDIWDIHKYKKKQDIDFK